MTDPIRQVIAEVVQRVAELPDRTSPDDWPEAMLVTSEELSQILEAALAAGPRPQAAEVTGKTDKTGNSGPISGCSENGVESVTPPAPPAVIPTQEEPDANMDESQQGKRGRTTRGAPGTSSEARELYPLRPDPRSEQQAALPQAPDRATRAREEETARQDTLQVEAPMDEADRRVRYSQYDVDAATPPARVRTGRLSLAEAPAVIREAPMDYNNLRASFQMLESDLHAENERLRAELSALRSSLSGVIAEMEKTTGENPIGPLFGAGIVKATQHWLATLKRLQGEP